MKTRILTLLSMAVSLVLLLGLVAGGAVPTIAQSKPSAVIALPLPIPSIAERSKVEAPVSVPDRAQVAAALHSTPLMFIENVGQFADAARFQVRGGTGTMWLSDNAIWITHLERAMFERSQVEGSGLDHANAEHEDELRQGVNLKLSFPGANPAPRIEPFDRLDTVVSYFIGDNPNQWHPDVPVWGGVRYVDLYPGIDLELTSTAGQWQQRIIARPGADPGTVRLRVEGANTLAVDTAGHLRLTTAIGDFTTVLFQLVTAGNFPVLTLGEKPQVTDSDILFPFALLTASTRPLSAVSPADNSDDLLYSTFLGGSDSDQGQAVAAGSGGVAYVAGTTYSSNFPTTPGAFDMIRNSTDVFVTKLNAAGSALVYSTFLGGLSSDFSRGMAVNGAGSVYVTGKTDSSDFPTTSGAFDTTYNGGGDAFAVKLAASGSSLVYSTFLGGSENDDSQDIAADGSGAAYVTGEAWSDGYPTTAGAFDTTFNGGNTDVFVTKLNATGSALVYSTFLGGSDSDQGFAIAVDGSGEVYVTGRTKSTGYSTTAGAFDTSYNGGTYDAFVTKLNATGSGLVYSTFLGGEGDYESGWGIAVDSGRVAYITGGTESSDFPTTPDAFDTTPSDPTCPWYAVCCDVFVTKLNATGSGLVYSTFLGGGEDDAAEGIAVDKSGAYYATGLTNSSSDFPTTPGAFDTTHNGGSDAFVAKFAMGFTANWLVYLPCVMRGWPPVEQTGPEPGH